MTKLGIDTALGQGSGWNAHKNKLVVNASYDDTGSNSRYFDLDAWFASKLPHDTQKTYPMLVVPKPSKGEKNKYAENYHPTVKPLKLMSYLITMGSREGDLVLDPFCGSGTTLEAANLLKRRFIGCELDPMWKPVIEARAFRRQMGS
jgi:site-specific DNA-methyltransferase (adenine-specific)